MTAKPIDISVGSSAEYEEFVAEIGFGEYFGITLSQESGEGNFEITAHSISQQGIEDFRMAHNPAVGKVPLDDFLRAIDDARSELIRLKRSATPDEKNG